MSPAAVFICHSMIVVAGMARSYKGLAITDTGFPLPDAISASIAALVNLTATGLIVFAGMARSYKRRHFLAGAASQNARNALMQQLHF